MGGTEDGWGAHVTANARTAVLELRMAARHRGANDDAAVQAAEALSEDLGIDLRDAADALTEQLLAGLDLEDAIAMVPIA